MLLGLLLPARTVCAQSCGVLLQESTTVPGDIQGARCNIMWDFDGPGPLEPELVIGCDRGHVMAFNGTRWRQVGRPLTFTALGTVAAPDPVVHKLVSFRGELHAIVAGFASSSNGGVFRWNGSQWVELPRASACGTISGWIVAAAEYNSELVVAGQNLRCGSITGITLAYNGTTWRRLGDMPYSATAVGNALIATSTGRLLLAGNLTRSGGQTMIAELVGDAWVSRADFLAASFSSLPIAAFHEINGELFACGAASQNFSNPPSLVFRENAAGLWETVVPGSLAPSGSLGWVSSILSHDGSLYLGGSGTSTSGPGLLVKVTGGVTQTGVFPLQPARITGGIVRYQDKIWTLGTTLFGSTPLGCRFQPPIYSSPASDGLNWSSVPALFAIDPTSFTFNIGYGAALGGQLVVSANLGSSAVTVLQGPAICNPFNATTAQLAPGAGVWDRPTALLSGQVRDMGVFNGEVIAVGNLAAPSGSPATPRIARLNGTAWTTFYQPMPAGSLATALTTWNNRLVVADSPSGATIQVRAWDGTAWSNLGSPLTMTAAYLAVADGVLYAAAQSGTAVFRYNGATWDALAAVPTAINALAGHGVDLYAGTSAGVRRWSGTSWDQLGGFPSPPTQPVVRALRSYAGSLYAGLSTSSQPLIRWSGSQWEAVVVPTTFGSGGPLTANVTALVPDGDTLAVLGQFGILNGAPYENAARLYIGPPRLLRAGAALANAPAFRQTLYASIEPEVYHDPGQSYRWRRDATPLADGPLASGAIVSGAATPYLRIAAASPAESGSFDCAVTNGCGQTVSSAAPVVVLPTCSIADVTGIGGPPELPDGLITGDDFNAFIGAFAGGDPLADITGIGGPPSTPDGLITGDDFNAFISAFAAGCP